MRYATMILLIGLVVPASVAARTWQVAQDGSGDFAVIQDAVDAAEDGDVIEIGPGRYLDYQTIYFGTIPRHLCLGAGGGVADVPGGRPGPDHHRADRRSRSHGT